MRDGDHRPAARGRAALVGHCPRTARRRRSRKPSTARRPRRATTFRVTHPFHPLRGREFELVDRRQAWGEDRVYYQDGRELKKLPATWTSATAVDPFVALSAGRALFRTEDLLVLATLIAREDQARPPRRKRRVSRK